LQSASGKKLLAPDKKKRRQAYLRFMAKDDSDELLDFFEQKKRPSLLGSENFISWVKGTFFEEKKHRQIPQSAQLAPELEQIKREVCRTYGVEEKDLLTAQRGKSNEPKNVAIYLCNDTLMELGFWHDRLQPRQQCR